MTWVRAGYMLAAILLSAVFVVVVLIAVLGADDRSKAALSVLRILTGGLLITVYALIRLRGTQ
jgi:hypothetical protein